MSDFSDKLGDWQKESAKPAPKPPPEPARPLADRLETMANMFTYSFWGWEYETETRDLLLEACKAIRTYEDIILRDGGRVE